MSLTPEITMTSLKYGDLTHNSPVACVNVVPAICVNLKWIRFQIQINCAHVKGGICGGFGTNLNYP